MSETPNLSEALATIDAHRRAADLILAQMGGMADSDKMTLTAGTVRKLCRMIRTYAGVLHDHADKVTKPQF